MATIGMSACVMLPRPGPMPLEASRGSQVSMDQALDLYARGHLRLEKCGMVRQDGAHTHYALRDELGRYPGSRAAYERAVRKEEGLLTALAWGFGIAGFTASAHLGAAAGNNDIPTAPLVAGYSIGGALVLGAAIVAIVSDNPMPEITETYNAALRADLALTPSQTEVVDREPKPSVGVRCF